MPAPVFEEPAPRKQKRRARVEGKPSKAARRLEWHPGSEPVKVKRPRKPRVVKQDKPHGGKFTNEMYKLIGALMELDIPSRNLVMEVAKALTK